MLYSLRLMLYFFACLPNHFAQIRFLLLCDRIMLRLPEYSRV
jgi:hypothetical protein